MSVMKSITVILFAVIVASTPAAAGESDQVVRLINPTPGMGGGEFPDLELDGDTLLAFTFINRMSPDYNRGAVQVHDRLGDKWTFTQFILPPGWIDGEEFLGPLALKGNWLAVYGKALQDDVLQRGVFIYKRDAGAWSLNQFLRNEASDISFGQSLEFAGGDLLIGAFTDLETGAVYVHSLFEGQWQMRETLTPPNGRVDEDFGRTIDASGDACVITSPVRTFSDDSQGKAYVYRQVSGTWTFEQFLRPTAEDRISAFQQANAIGPDRVVTFATITKLDPFSTQIVLIVFARDPGTGEWMQQHALPIDQTTLSERRGQLGQWSLIVGEQSILASLDFDGGAHLIGFSQRADNWDEQFWYVCDNACAQSVPPVNPNMSLAGTTERFGVGWNVNGLSFISENYTAMMVDGLGADCNDNGFNDEFEALIGEDCNSNGVPDACEPAAEFDCNGNGVCDRDDIAGETSGDCNGNGTPDECELQNDIDGDGVIDVCDNCVDIANAGQADCDADGIGDACAIAQSLSEDCDNDGVPDECAQGYQVGASNSGGIYWVSSFGNDDLLSLQRFVVRPGEEIVIGISLHWQARVPRPATLLLYRDPNNDGDPIDAELLLAMDVMSTPEFDEHVVYPVEPTYVGEAGQVFFAGAVSTGELFPARQAGALGTNAVIGLYDILRFDESDLGTNLIYPLGYSENIRNWAIHVSTSQSQRCECPHDFVGGIGRAPDGLVNELDLMALLGQWGGCAEPCPPLCPADITGDCAVDVFDLLSLLAQWGPCE